MRGTHELFISLADYDLMLISHSIVLACFCFKNGLIRFYRSSFFDIFDFFLVLYRKRCEAQLRHCVEICHSPLHKLSVRSIKYRVI